MSRTKAFTELKNVLEQLWLEDADLYVQSDVKSRRIPMSIGDREKIARFCVLSFGFACINFDVDAGRCNVRCTRLNEEQIRALTAFLNQMLAADLL